jgi:hypothetical protein
MTGRMRIVVGVGDLVQRTENSQAQVRYLVARVFWFGLKTKVDGFPGFGLKIGGFGFPSLCLKTGIYSC